MTAKFILSVRHHVFVVGGVGHSLTYLLGFVKGMAEERRTVDAWTTSATKTGLPTACRRVELSSLSMRDVRAQVLSSAKTCSHRHAVQVGRTLSCSSLGHVPHPSLGFRSTYLVDMARHSIL
jgi:hypothetical protein